MGTDTHAQQRNRRDLANPPPGRDDDDTRALQAGKQGATPRRSTQAKESGHRPGGRDEHRSGSDSNRTR